ncbi:MAG TPA: alpha/beta hydrolase [Pirellulales bacterium]|nr:alpha/beta hydrolase [Pirellulales bacterium]
MLLDLSAPTVTECVRLPLAGGGLEGLLSYPAIGDAWSAVVVVGPHPLLGGDMHNNVVSAVGEHLAAAGCLTLRFNYQGVGDSTGERCDDPRRLDEFWTTSRLADESDRWRDLDAAVRFARGAASSVPLALVGYSFGCAVSCDWLDQGGRAACLAAIAPTVARHDYAPLERLTLPKLVLAASNDFASGETALVAAADRWCEPKECRLADLDDHFFRGCEPWLIENLLPFLQRVSHEHSLDGGN